MIILDIVKKSFLSLLFTSLNGGKDEKTLYKLMTNAVYGKLIENVWNKMDVRLVKNEGRLFKMDIKTKLHVTKDIS